MSRRDVLTNVDSSSLVLTGEVDKTPVIHLDWSLARINAGFYLSFLSMRARFQKNWTRYKVLDCQRLGAWGCSI